MEFSKIANCDLRRRRPWPAPQVSALRLHGTWRRHAVERSAQPRATDVNIGIIRTFVRLREILASDREHARKVEEHDRQIGVLFDAVRKLLAAPEAKKTRIGYIHVDA